MRLLGAIACELDLDVCHFDGDNASVQSKLNKDIYVCVYVCMYVCMYVFIKLHITAQSGPVIYSFYATACNPPGGYLS